jgi:hypothetical protein
LVFSASVAVESRGCPIGDGKGKNSRCYTKFITFFLIRDADGGRCGGGEVEGCLVSHDGTLVKTVQHDNKVVTDSTFQTIEDKQRA